MAIAGKRIETEEFSRQKESGYMFVAVVIASHQFCSTRFYGKYATEFISHAKQVIAPL